MTSPTTPTAAAARPSEPPHPARLGDRRLGHPARAAQPAGARPGHAAEPLHPRQHDLRLLLRAPVVPGPLPRRCGAGRDLDRARHLRRGRGSRGRGDHALRPPVRLARRPHLVRHRARGARLHGALPAYPVWAWAGAMFWLACAAYRLARFNVTIDPLADKRYFVGLASPRAAGVVISTVLAIGDPLYDWAPLVPVAAGVLPAALIAPRSGSGRSATCSRRGTGCSGSARRVIVIGSLFFPGRRAWRSPTAMCSPAARLGHRPAASPWSGGDAVAPLARPAPSVIMPPEVDDTDDVDDGRRQRRRRHRRAPAGDAGSVRRT